MIDLKEKGYSVPIPQKLIINFIPPKINISNYCSQLIEDSNHYYAGAVFDRLREYYTAGYENDFFYNLGFSCVVNYWLRSSDSYPYSCPSDDQIYIPCKFTENSIESFIDYINRCNESFLYLVSDEPYKTTITFLEFINQNKDIIRKKFVNSKKFQYVVKIDDEIAEFMIEFLNKYRAMCGDYYFLTFSWGMSSGESNLLRMFTKFRYLLDGPTYYKDLHSVQNNPHNVIVNKFNDGNEKICDSLVILIDEADLSYHPEWQRSFIALLTAFLSKLYKDPYYEGAEEGCKNIQIILTTHSPLILGDFPMASVIYLTKANGAVQIEESESINPFGQNLYTILKDGFYLKRTMGELAHLKLNEVIKGLHCIRNTMDEYESPSDEDEHVSDMLEKLEKLKRYQKTICHLPDGIIREKIQQEIDDCRYKINYANKPMLLRRKEELMNELADVENAIKKQEGCND